MADPHRVPLAAERFDLLSGPRLQLLLYYRYYRRNPKFMEERRLLFTSKEIRFRTVSLDSTSR